MLFRSFNKITNVKSLCAGRVPWWPHPCFLTALVGGKRPRGGKATAGEEAEVHSVLRPAPPSSCPHRPHTHCCTSPSPVLATLTKHPHPPLGWSTHKPAPHPVLPPSPPSSPHPCAQFLLPPLPSPSLHRAWPLGNCSQERKLCSCASAHVQQALRAVGPGHCSARGGRRGPASLSSPLGEDTDNTTVRRQATRQLQAWPVRERKYTGRCQGTELPHVMIHGCCKHVDESESNHPTPPLRPRVSMSPLPVKHAQPAASVSSGHTRPWRGSQRPRLWLRARSRLSTASVVIFQSGCQASGWLPAEPVNSS